MLSKYPFIVPLPGTTKLSHLEEDLRAADFVLTAAEIKEIESKIEKIGVVGDRYDALQQSRVEYYVYSPKGAKNLPCIVIVHGGGWLQTTKTLCVDWLVNS
jgi:acetyl esterase/lipase